MLRVRVLGGGREVGRAAVSVGLGDSERSLLLDYGVNFDEDDKPRFPAHIKPSEVVGLILTHAHLDHVGAAPMLHVTSRVPTIATALTKKLCEIMIKDFIKISGYYLPYEEVDLYNMIDSIPDYSYEREIHLGDYRIKLLNAGHIPGSSMTYVEVGEFSVVYTGDVNTIDTRLVSRANVSGVKADVVIIEATYGWIKHPPRELVEKEFLDAVKEVTDRGGNVLIPAFSLGRAQEILTLLYEKFEGSVFYDGMIRQIYDVFISYPEYINKYEELLKSKEEFKPVVRPSQRRKIIEGRGNVIVASAGMLKGGPAVYYLKKLAGNPLSAVFMVSYQAPGTPGRHLLEDGIPTEEVGHVKARVQWFDFSSHAGIDGLLELLKNFREIKYVIVVHTSEKVGKFFTEKVRETLGDVPVYLPHNNEEIILE
ncbi:MAG: MBL fold metallo-hydrolase [Desulfurococcaceae archaeon TW002]